PKMEEDRPTPKEVYNFRTYLFAAIASAGTATIGYDSAFIGGTLALDSFSNEFGFNTKSSTEVNLIKANIVSLYQAGAFFGAIFAYLGGHYLGRRRGLIVFGTLFILGAGVMLAMNSERGLGPLYAGRVIAGMGIGGISNLIPIYVSELSPPAIRGRLVGMWEVGWQIGALVGFWINYAISETMAESRKQWMIPFGIQLIPAGILITGIFFTDESPRWLIANGKREKGIAILGRLRNLPVDHSYIREEIALIDQAIDLQAQTIGLGFNAPFVEVKKNKSVQWRLFLGASLFVWQNGTGINAINYYSPTVFKSMGIQGTNASLFSTGIFGVVKTVTTIIWILWLIDYIGRRNLLLIGAIGGSIGLWIVGGYIAVAHPVVTANSSESAGGRAAMAFLYIWTVFYTASWSGTPWCICSEIFDQNMRSLGQAFAAANNWFWTFIIARFTPQMFDKMSYGVFFFFATFQIISIFYVFFLVPETKGVPLEQMDLLFAKGLPPRKAHREVMLKLQAMDEETRREVVDVAEHKSGQDFVEDLKKEI
ncbi:quinate permease, partial [Kockiozyma suomiensis]|uniref:quinate permease n=1 Tax=Kockiozyma suomiensis TaxID=1337062 RepID=UPI00334355AF